MNTTQIFQNSPANEVILIADENYTGTMVPKNFKATSGLSSLVELKQSLLELYGSPVNAINIQYPAASGSTKRILINGNERIIPESAFPIVLTNKLAAFETQLNQEMELIEFIQPF